MEPRKLEWTRGEAPAPKTIKITISKELPDNLTTVDLIGDAFDYEPVTVKKCSFPPSVTPECSVLVLGSLPGDESLRQAQYYACLLYTSPGGVRGRAEMAAPD